MTKHLAAGLVLAAFSASSHANVTCSDLKYGSDGYDEHMNSLAVQANFAGHDYTRYHEKFIASQCAGNAKAANALVEQNKVSARDATAIRRLVVAEAAPAPFDASAAVGPINDAFVTWGQSWAMDQYIPNSVRPTEQGAKDGAYYVRGSFKFARFGSVATIPFSSSLKKSRDGYQVISVCYNDTTSGMTDCSNSGMSARYRQLMGAIVAVGVLSALSDSGSSADSSSGSTMQDSSPACETRYESHRDDDGNTVSRNETYCNGVRKHQHQNH